MKLLIIQPVFHDGFWRNIGDVLEMDCDYATMPRWAVEYRSSANLGAPDRRSMLERRPNRPPPREPLKVEEG